MPKPLPRTQESSTRSPLSSHVARPGHRDRAAEIVEALRSGSLSARSAELSGLRLVRADLSGLDLSRADFSGADLSGANLSGAHLLGSNLEACTLFEADLS